VTELLLERAGREHWEGVAGRWVDQTRLFVSRADHACGLLPCGAEQGLGGEVTCSLSYPLEPRARRGGELLGVPRVFWGVFRTVGISCRMSVP